MNQNIRYKGLSLTPDELAAPQGSLAMSANAEIYNGSVRPSIIAGTEIGQSLLLPNSNTPAKLWYVHQTTAYRHFIAGTNQVIYWYNSTTSAQGLIKNLGTGVSVIKIESIGNTLVIMATDGIHYALWKSSSYVYLGQKPPFIKLTFGLSEIQPESYDRSTVDHDADSTDKWYNAWYNTGVDVSDCEIAHSGTKVAIKTEEARVKITEAVWACVNMAHDVITKNGLFYAPFIVRYGYRMYDNQTIIMHSAPVFMPVAHPHPFLVNMINATSNQERTTILDLSDNINITEGDSSFRVTKITAVYHPHAVQLTYRMEGDSDKQGLEMWSDIIKSIDIFVSPQFLRTDSSKIIETASPAPFNHVLQNGALVEEDSIRTFRGAATFDIPEISDESYFSNIANCAEFFLLHSFQIEDQLSMTFTNLPVNTTTMASITTQDRMSDDYKTHNLLLPSFNADNNPISGLYMYNRRLNAYGLSEKLFSGFLPAYGQMPYHVEEDNYEKVRIDSVYIVLETDNGRKVVKAEYQSGVDVSIMMLCRSLLFYPDARAVKMIINVYSYTDSAYKHMELPMTPHNSLNGAIVKNLWSRSSLPLLSDTYSDTVDDIVLMPNKIYTSDVNNPYYFPPNSINTVGTGTIFGIAANTRALSSGTAIGKFGLLAFASDGIWILDVSSTGTYQDIHNVSREVCSNPDSICQIDQQVIFATARAMSYIVEQNCESISDVLFGSLGSGISRDTFPALFAYFDEGQLDSQETAAYKTVMRRLLAFNSDPVSFFQTATIIYDFTNSRLIVLSKTTDNENDDLQCVMIYSISDGTWSTAIMPKTLSVINSYPHPYIQLTDGSVFCLDRKYPYNEDDVEGNTIDGVMPTLLLTRALSFGDSMYFINDFAHNKIQQGKTIMFLFGSNDLRSWHYIGRTNQNHSYYQASLSYRYFRIALFSVMSPNDQYLSTSLNIKEKFPKL